MKRLVWLVIAALMLATRGFAYDGPTPVTYDHTLSTIRVVFTSQGKILQAGRSFFTMTAYVPIIADTVGQSVQLQVRRWSAAGDVLVSSCSFVPTLADVGQTVAYPCEVFDIVPGVTTGGTTGLYPRVIRNSTSPGTVLDHNGQALRLTVPVAGDDTYEQNDLVTAARDLGTVASPILITDLVWLDADHFKFTTPVGAGSAEIRINFWQDAADLDLYVSDSNGTFVDASAGSSDEERVNLAVGPGQTYYVDVEAYDSAPAFYDLYISVGAPDIITITAGPTGGPNPVASDNNVTLSVAATDSVAHSLNYFWLANCPSLPTPGTFSNRFIANPTWTAPTNATGATRNCSLKVEVSDDYGVLTQASYVQAVTTLPDTVTINTGPSGAPNPAASGGTVVLALSATDSYTHSLSYSWTATCPGLPDNGSFSPSGAVASPTWTAPVNQTASVQACTIAVSANDGLGNTATGSYSQTISIAPHTVTITTGPTATPDPVASDGVVTLALSGADSYGHALGYAWSATCPGLPSSGAFTPSANVITPTWTAPHNITGAQRTCTLTVTLNDGQGQTATASTPVHVDAAADTLTITAGPTATPEPVASAAAAAASVAAVDSYNHSLTYAWTASCAGGLGNGSFDNAAAQNPTWTAPVNATGTQQTCTLAVGMDDGAGHTANGSVTRHVNSVADAVSITAGPTGTPEPVASAGSVVLGVTASDSIIGHTVTYAWSATCDGGLGIGSFDNAAVQTPTWTAPLNATGAAQACALAVVASDGLGQTATATWTAHVNSIPDAITVTAAPAGTPEPVASGGSVALSASATDSIVGHTVSYAWSAACAGGLGNGSLDNAVAQNPTWTAPINATGAPQACTLTVTMADGHGQSEVGTWTAHVASIADVVTITGGPTGTPEPVASAGVVTLALTATDSIVGHTLTYAWTATCAGGLGTGSFDNAAAAQPTWTAPANATGAAHACTLDVVVGDGLGQTATGSTTATVQSVADAVTITAGPTGTPEPVASAGSVGLGVTASDAIVGHTVTYSWSATCAGGLGIGTFDNATAQTPTWTAPANATGAAAACALAVVASDGLGQTATATWTAHVSSIPDVITITAAPAGTPEPVASSGSVALSVAATDSIVGHTVSFAWSATCAGGLGTGTFDNAAAQNPSWTAPVNATGVAQACALSVVLTDGAGQSESATWTAHVASMADVVTITAGPTGTPEPVASAGAVTLALTATDSILSHTLTYAWTATCAGSLGTGTFDNAAAAQPTWTAPANATGAAHACTLDVVVGDGLGQTATGSTTATVQSVADAVTITAGPTGTPEPVASAGSVVLGVTASDAIVGHTVTYAWSATCAGGLGIGTLDSATAQTPTWTAPVNATGAAHACALTVVASDGLGQTATAAWTAHVSSIPDVITITAAPTGTPEPVASSGAVALSVAATDSIVGHTVSFAWSATCAGGLGTGTFDNAAGQNPSWTAPVNATGVAQACALSVVLTDGAGQSESATWTAHVASIADVVTITAGPTGTPEPVASAGAVMLALTATDSIVGHTLTYAWTATCAGSLGTGSFDNATAPTPTWTAPVNATGAAHACTLDVVVADGLGQTATSSTTATVQSVADAVTITAGPTGTPEPVASAGSVGLGVTASDAIVGHTVTYAWSATCAGGLGIGTFDNAAVPTPTWTAPLNATGAAQPCALTVVASDGLGQTATATWTAHVSSIPDVITITAAPAGTPEPVASSGSVALSVAATDSIVGHTVSFAWSATCAGGLGTGTFDNAAGQNPSWTAPVNATGVAQACALSVVLTDGAGQSESATWTAHVASIADVVTITAGPTGTPEPVASSGAVTLALTATDSILSHTLTYAWTATCAGGLGTGTFDNAAAAQPTWTAPVNATGAAHACTLDVVVGDGLGQTATGSTTATVQSVADAVTITAGPTGTPEPVASAGSVVLGVTASDAIVGHTVTYAWSATCAGGLGIGTFDNATAQTPTWTAPVNATGTAAACALAVVASDGLGQTATAAWTAHVSSIPDVITITAAPAGTPEPVASSGSVALSVAATDSIVGHTVGFAWSATCAGGLGIGSFDNAAGQNPSWTAPVNATGVAQACAISVVLTDGAGQSESATWTAHVASIADVVTITAGPTGTPEPVASAGAVTLALTATDSILSHTLTYAWTATCAGGLGTGSFDNATAPTPTWTAPVNATGTPHACTLDVVVSDGLGQTATSSTTATVQSVADAVTITAGPTGTPEPVASAGSVVLGVTASDAILGHTVTYAWSATCAGGLGIGTFDNATAQTPTWTAPVNATGAAHACALAVVASDGLGQTATATWTAHVSSIPDVITITAAPAGTPEPVASSGSVALSVAATDSIVGHTLTYAWTATCAGGLGTGTFDNAAAQTPSWTAPVNATGVAQACTLTVALADGHSQTANANWTAHVESVPDVITITGNPAGTPDPVASQGVVTLSVAATDSILGHSLSYSWTATCSGSLAAGAFAPGANVQNPAWTAPVNLSGSPQTCALEVVASDGLGQTASATWTEHVEPVPDVVTITAGPTGTPNPVASSGVVGLTVTAADPYNHTLAYAWTATCAGGLSAGAFSDASAETPSWTAPVNATGTAQACTIGVAVNDGLGHTASATWTSQVESVPDVVTITAGPTGTPDPVASSGQVALTLTSSDSILGHTLTYAWTATCAGGLGTGSFSSASAAEPTWTAATNATGTQQACTLSVVVADGHGQTANGSWTAHVESVPDAITITGSPAGTPDPVASQGVVTLSVSATDSIVGHTVTYAWTASCGGSLGTGSFSDASAQNPTWTAPTNLTLAEQVCTLSVAADDGHGQTQTGTLAHRVSAVPDVVTMTVAPAATPDPVASQGAVTLSATADDPYSHALTYAWTAICPGLGSTGSFVPGAAAQNPTWTAPKNATGTQHTCTLTVVASDAFGHDASASVASHVNSVADAITITDAAVGTPEPAASSASVTLSVAASDSILGHALTYAWTAACTGGLGAGTFSDATAQTPTWTAPVNATGSQQACTFTAAIADGQGQTASSTWVGHVDSVTDAVTITAGPTPTPNPVASSGSVSLAVTATDSITGHTLTYAWSATCAGLSSTGTFAPSDTDAAPAWTAPVNKTGSSQTCTIAVTAADSFGHSASNSVSQTVTSLADAITVTAAISAGPNPVASGGTVNLSVGAIDSLDHALSYAWSATCPDLSSNGAFDAPLAQSPVWTAPVNMTTGPKTCLIAATITDGFGQQKIEFVNQVVTRRANVIQITAGPTGTPNPVDSAGTVNLSVTATSTWGTLTYAWTATCPGSPSNGSFQNETTATPTWLAPANGSGGDRVCVISVSVGDGVEPPQVATHTQTVKTALVCTYTLTAVVTSLTADGGPGSVNVQAPAGCSWTGTTDAAWVSVGSGAGSGNGVLTFTTSASQEPTSRTGNLSVEGQTVPVTQEGIGYRYYFAEGATINGFFETRFALLNRDPSDAATVSIDFQLKDTTTVLTHDLVLGPNTRTTIDVSTLGNVNPLLAALASAEFSTVVRSDRPLVADRTMTWDKTGYGSHAETAIGAPASTWYFAEGATIGDFELYYLIQNPNPTPLDFTVTYLLPPPAAPIVRTYPIGPNTRTNVAVHAEPGLENVEVSAVIESPADKPIIVERAMYLTTGSLFYGAGHESAGIRSPERQWFFAEGATGDFFDLFILIGNPNAATAHITATFLFDDGTTCSTTADVDAKSRYNIWVDVLTIPGCPRSLADAALSTTITSDIPVVAERTMWWPGPSPANWAEAHNAAGATTTGTLWALADGEQGGARNTDTYVLVANTSPYAGTARVTLYFEDGTSVQKDVPLAASARTNIAIGMEFGAGVANKRFGTAVESLPVAGQTGPAQIVVERAMYSNGPGAPVWAAGTDVLATKVR